MQPDGTKRLRCARRWERAVGELSASCSPRACILALIGGALGVLIAYWGIELIRSRQSRRGGPVCSRMGTSGDQSFRCSASRLLLSFASGVLFGLAPAWQVSKPDLNDALKEGGRRTSGGSHRLRGLLVISEVALSLMLLVSAGLLVRSFLSLLKTNPGFNPDNLLTMNLNLPVAKYKDGPTTRCVLCESWCSE